MSSSFSRLPVLPEANMTHTARHFGSDRLGEEPRALSAAEERSSAVEGLGDGGTFWTAFPALKMQPMPLYIPCLSPAIPSDSSAFISFVTVITLSIFTKKMFHFGENAVSLAGVWELLSALAAPLSHDDDITTGLRTMKSGADKSSIPFTLGWNELWKLLSRKWPC